MSIFSMWNGILYSKKRHPILKNSNKNLGIMLKIWFKKIRIDDEIVLFTCACAFKDEYQWCHMQS